MPRISVSLPEELTAGLEAIKGTINVSQVCREALEQRLAVFKRAAEQQGEDLNMVDLIDRLREERRLIDGKFENFARRNAVSWLRTSSYMEIKSVAVNHNSSNMTKYKLPRGAFQIMKKDMGREKLSCEGVEAIMYKTAWLDRVRAVWTEVEEQADDTEPEESAGAQEPRA